MRPAISVVARQSRKFPHFYPGWWAVFACFWLAVLAWGIGFYGHGVYLTQLEATRSGSALVLSFATTGYYLEQIPVDFTRSLRA